jgi:SAM-dependent methyltransferase
MEEVEKKWTSDLHGQSLKNRLLFLKQKAAYRFACGYAKGQIVLDVGCGSGYGAYTLSLWADAVCGTDPNEEAIAYCQKRWRRGNLVFTTEARGVYDMSTCFQVLEHLNNPNDLFLGLSRGTKRVAIITTPNAERRWLNRNETPWNPEHVREYYADEFEALMRKYFSSVQMGGIHGSPDADLMERMRISGRGKVKVAVNREESVGFSDDDFTVGPVDGCLDLLAVCK